MEDWVLNAKREAYAHGYFDGLNDHKQSVFAYSSILDVVEAKQLVRRSVRSLKAAPEPQQSDQDMVYRQFCQDVENLAEENNELKQQNFHLQKRAEELALDLETMQHLIERYQNELLHSFS